MKIFINNPIGNNFNFHNNTISHLNYFSYLKYKKTFFKYLKKGLLNNNLFASLRNPEYLHQLFITKDKEYWKYLNEFKERFQNYDVIVMNPGLDLVHPEFLYENFKNSLKVIHFVDDPHTTYSYCLPFIGIFDAATYTTPSYSEKLSMDEIIKLNGIENTLFVPNCMSNLDKPKWNIDELAYQLESRISKSFYIGNFYTGKADRLIKLKKKLKNKFEIHGNFALKGYSLFLYSLIKRNLLNVFPKKLDKNSWNFVHHNYSVGINMHLSSPSVEVGNARLYELPYNGVAQICDISSVSLLENIFEPDKEIITYRTIDECVEKTNILLKDFDLRKKIAIAGYKKAISEYSYENILLKQINWFKNII